MIKILYCGLKYDYADKSRGYSYEYLNFYKTLESMEGVKVFGFFIDEEGFFGKELMNKRLLSRVIEMEVDLVFCFLFRNEISPDTINTITNKYKIKTFNWFADDHWRVFNYSKLYAPLFTLVSTTDEGALKYYKGKGINNVILLQWGVNPRLYLPIVDNNVLDQDMTFVGQRFGERVKYINKLMRKGFSVKAYGSGWSGSRLSFEEMLKVFHNSKINLNFTEIYKYNIWQSWRPLLRIFLERDSGNFKFRGWNLRDNLNEYLGGFKRMIKGRNFEIPACGGFLLTGYAEGLEKYYELGKEVVVFKDDEDLFYKCRYYLENEDERKKIALAGYERTINHHVYEKRISDIFLAMELK